MDYEALVAAEMARIMQEQGIVAPSPARRSFKQQQFAAARAEASILPGMSSSSTQRARGVSYNSRSRLDPAELDAQAKRREAARLQGEVLRQQIGERDRKKAAAKQAKQLEDAMELERLAREQGALNQQYASEAAKEKEKAASKESAQAHGDRARSDLVEQRGREQRERMMHKRAIDEARAIGGRGRNDETFVLEKGDACFFQGRGGEWIESVCSDKHSEGTFTVIAAGQKRRRVPSTKLRYTRPGAPLEQRATVAPARSHAAVAAVVAQPMLPANALSLASAAAVPARSPAADAMLSSSAFGHSASSAVALSSPSRVPAQPTAAALGYGYEADAGPNFSRRRSQDDDETEAHARKRAAQLEQREALVVQMREREAKKKALKDAQRAEERRELERLERERRELAASAEAAQVAARLKKQEQLAQRTREEAEAVKRKEAEARAETLRLSAVRERKAAADAEARAAGDASYANAKRSVSPPLHQSPIRQELGEGFQSRPRIQRSSHAPFRNAAEPTAPPHDVASDRWFSTTTSGASTAPRQGALAPLAQPRLSQPSLALGASAEGFEGFQTRAKLPRTPGREQYAAPAFDGSWQARQSLFERAAAQQHRGAPVLSPLLESPSSSFEHVSATPKMRRIGETPASSKPLPWAARPQQPQQELAGVSPVRGGVRAIAKLRQQHAAEAGATAVQQQQPSDADSPARGGVRAIAKLRQQQQHNLHGQQQSGQQQYDQQQYDQQQQIRFDAEHAVIQQAAAVGPSASRLDAASGLIQFPWGTVPAVGTLHAPAMNGAGTIQESLQASLSVLSQLSVDARAVGAASASTALSTAAVAPSPSAPQRQWAVEAVAPVEDHHRQQQWAASAEASAAEQQWTASAAAAPAGHAEETQWAQYAAATPAGQEAGMESGQWANQETAPEWTGSGAETAATETAAAVTLQSAQRARVAKSEVGKRRAHNASDVEQSAYTQQREAETSAAITLQSTHRMRAGKARVEARRHQWTTRQEEEQQRAAQSAAATTLQSAQRMRCAKAAAAERQQLWAAGQEEEEQWTAQSAAATTLQSAHRMRSAKAAVVERQQLWSVEQEMQQQYTAAVTLQSVQRVRDARRIIDAARIDHGVREHAAVTLQSAQRMRCARTLVDVQRREWAISEAEAVSAMDNAQYAAAMTLQNAARSRQSQRALGSRRFEHAMRENAAVALQGGARGHLARSELQRNAQARANARDLSEQDTVVGSALLEHATAGVPSASAAIEIASKVALAEAIPAADAMGSPEAEGEAESEDNVAESLPYRKFAPPPVSTGRPCTAPSPATRPFYQHFAPSPVITSRPGSAGW